MRPTDRPKAGPSQQELFERLIKDSHHFYDAMNTHRRATAAIIAGLIKVIDDQASVDAVLIKLEESTGNISDDTSRRLLCQLIKDALKGRSGAL